MYPKVSIIIPGWNAETYIYEAICSALDQSYKNIEVIVVNDGSTDKTQSVIDQFKDKVKSISVKNGGASKARNTGLQFATGKYIKFLDADDYLLPGCISTQVNVAQQLSEFEFPCGRTYSVNEENGLIHPHAARDAKSVRSQEKLSSLIEHVPITSSCLLSATAVKSIGGFSEDLIVRQDFDFFVRLLFSGYTPIMTNESAYVYRQYSSSNRISKQISYARFLCELEMYKKLFILMRKLTDKDKQADFAKGLGRSMWVTARNILRSGHEDIAITLFKYAKLCDKRHCIVGKQPYLLMSKIIGPIPAENVAKIFKNSSQKLKSKV